MKKLTKNIQEFTLPLIASNILQMFIATASLSIMARKSVESLGAINTVENFLYSVGGILGAFSLAFNIYGAKSLGEKNKEQLKKLISSAFYLCLAVGIGFMLLIWFFGQQFLHIFYGFNGEILELAEQYLLILSPYILFTLLTFVFTNLLKIEKKTNKVFIISVTSGLIQLGLNDLFINGKFGFPTLGIVGAGFSVMISLSFVLISYMFLLRRLLLSSISVKPNRIKFLLIKSFPMMGQEVLEGVLFVMVFDAFVTRLGSDILASYSLIGQGLTIARLPALMYGNAVTVFASEAYGEKNKKKTEKVVQISFVSSFIWYVLIAGAILLFLNPLSMLFTSEESVLVLVPVMAPLLLVLLCSAPLYEIFKYALQSMELSPIVWFATAVVNAIILLVILALWEIGLLNYTLLFCLYGLNFIILGAFFFFLFKRKIKTEV